MTVVTHVRCLPEWVDYNGHMSEAYYVLVLGHATDAVLDAIGMDADHRTAQQTSVFTTEAHVRYLDEVSDGDEIETRSQVVGVSSKGVWIWHELWVGGTLRATEEILGLHVSTATDRVTPFPDAVRAELDRLLVEPPPEAGRSIRLRS